jgi:hypothetical protein
MADPYKGKLAGHALRVSRIGSTPFSPCQSMCECGASSGRLSSEKQARTWHREHKADMIDRFVIRGVDDRGREVHL